MGTKHSGMDDHSVCSVASRCYSRESEPIIPWTRTAICAKFGKVFDCSRFILCSIRILVYAHLMIGRNCLSFNIADEEQCCCVRFSMEDTRLLEYLPFACTSTRRCAPSSNCTAFSSFPPEPETPCLC